ncbi:MAG: glycosyltransferase [bacterium]
MKSTIVNRLRLLEKKILYKINSGVFLVKSFLRVVNKDGLFVAVNKTFKFLVAGIDAMYRKITPGAGDVSNKNLNLFRSSESASDFRPKITIIVPNFNHEKYLEQRLDSIYSQDYENYEVILMDDCSSDGSRKILSEYAEKYKEKTRCIFNEVNSGSVFRQWKRGIEEAKGELIWIAESDDYCSSNLISSLVPFFANEAIMLAYCRTVFVKNGEPFWDIETYLRDIDPDKWKSDFIESAHQIVNSAMSKRNIIPNVSSVIFRNPGSMKLLSDEKWLSLRFCGDLVFYLNIMRGGAIAYSVRATNFYRQHDKNTSTGLQTTDLYFKEHEYAALTVAELYSVIPEVFDWQDKMLREYWKMRRPTYSKEAFDLCYNVEKVKARQSVRKPNLAMFGYAFMIGGGETFPIVLANLFYERGYGVTYIDCDREPRISGIRKMLNSAIPVVRCSKSADCPDIVQAIGAEVAHSHHGGIDIDIGRQRELMPKCGHVVTMHGIYELAEEERLKMVLPILCKRVDQWVYTAEKNLGPFKRHGFYEENRFLKIDNALVRSALNPVSRKDLGISNDAFVFCLISRAMPEKGWEEAIMAVGEARRVSGKDIWLVLVGDGPEKEKIKEKAPDFVSVIGYASNVRDYYATSDMGILPSRFQGESFPFTVIDCLFAGKPVLASNVGEVKNMLTATDCSSAGAIFDLVDWTIPHEEFTSLIVRCASDCDFYLKMVAAVPQVAKKFDVDVMFSKYDACYERARGLRGK